MLKREKYGRLLAWKMSQDKRALCLIGARQVGKTSLVREFGKREYADFLELNFVEDERAKIIFDGSLNANEIIAGITSHLRKSPRVGKTLIFLDEIQACPNARAAIKFLVQDGRFDYIESGSLLGVTYQDVKSYPVGYEEIVRLYPMDFCEFLKACEMPDETLALMQDCFDKVKPLPMAVHQALKKLFLNYMAIGGMPKVVDTFLSTHDMGKVLQLQEDILWQYRKDIVKYSTGADKLHIQGIFDGIPGQLSDKNRRFIVNSISPNARLNRYENAFRWLDEAGVALPCYNVLNPQGVLSLNERRSLFKLYMADQGLLVRASSPYLNFEIMSETFDGNAGYILENSMAQQFKANGFSLYYYDSKKFGEVDFVLQKGKGVALVEVKSGKGYRRHAALDRIIAQKDWKFDGTFVLCPDNVSQEGQCTYLPWYMAMLIKPDAMPKYEFAGQRAAWL